MTASATAEVLSMALSTVSAVLLRERLGKRSRLVAPEPPNRYERCAAGELVHIDITKRADLVRGHGVTGNRRQRAPRVGARRLGSARTHGNAERFIQTVTRECAQGRLYASSAERTDALNALLNHYNDTRPHGSLDHKPPGSRRTKAPGNYS
jgi:transposase InsO family protein